MKTGETSQRIMSADECTRRLSGIRGQIKACYVLWDRTGQSPVYVGTARNVGRIRSHLKKDSVRDGKIGLTYRNPEFLAYVERQPEGWLGVSFELFATEAEARERECSYISQYGLRRNGGLLFNRRMSG